MITSRDKPKSWTHVLTASLLAKYCSSFLVIALHKSAFPFTNMYSCPTFDLWNRRLSSRYCKHVIYYKHPVLFQRQKPNRNFIALAIRFCKRLWTVKLSRFHLYCIVVFPYVVYLCIILSKCLENFYIILSKCLENLF